MGYKDKKYHRDLTQQINDRLTKMLHAGEGTSKRDAVADGTEREKIFSYSTYESYFRHCKYFSRYVRERHPECTTLKKARRYVKEWLQYRADTGNVTTGEPLSAWTLALERQALGKLFGIKPDDPDFFITPKRRRVDIKRSRGEAKRDRHFSEKNHYELVEFCRGTGCRRNVLKKLEGRDLYTRERAEKEMEELKAKGSLTEKEQKHMKVLEEGLRTFPDQEYFIHHRRDKGGKYRLAPIIGKQADKIIKRMQDTPWYEKVWKYVPDAADIHSYRAEYATDIYRMYARPIDELPYDRMHKGIGRRYQSGVYVCRKDESGKRLMRDACMKASMALGHSRIEVVANNYLRGL